MKIAPYMVLRDRCRKKIFLKTAKTRCLFSLLSSEKKNIGSNIWIKNNFIFLNSDVWIKITPVNYDLNTGTVKQHNVCKRHCFLVTGCKCSHKNQYLSRSCLEFRFYGTTTQRQVLIKFAAEVPHIWKNTHSRSV